MCRSPTAPGRLAWSGSATPGIEPSDQKPPLVKSTNHVAAAFGPIPEEVIQVDPDGPLSRDNRKIPCTRVRCPIQPGAETTPGLFA
jgi:microcystin degradation protein MlrC